jgi:hypothetical protein
VVQIGAQTSDFPGQILSQAVEMKGMKEKLQSAKNKGISRAVSLFDAVGQMVHAAGFEPAKGKGISVNQWFPYIYRDTKQ